MSPAFPLTALVGQDALVEALLVNAVDPGDRRGAGARRAGDGEVHRGPRPRAPAAGGAGGGRAAARVRARRPRAGGAGPSRGALGARPAPLVELPVGATADRLVGALELAEALERGVHAFEPGLLARAHRGVLYVDEVNLLPDHLVDLLLDVAASGVCIVEREAISRRAPGPLPAGRAR